MEIEEKYMRRSIALAAKGRGEAKPNPMVGAVIVHKSKIIGEGYHRKYGEGHAEVNAIRSVKDNSMLRESTMYVSLEPCSHHGKTPPCVDLIIEKGIPKVVVACLDPFPEVSGRGIKKLINAGVEVVSGTLEHEAWKLNRVFMTAHTKQRPYVILKWAQSVDGFIDKIREDTSAPPVVLSSPHTAQLVHKLRAETSAIMVGTNTALLDNPSLTVRSWAGNSPVRVVIDRKCRVPSNFHLLDDSIKTIVFTESINRNHGNTEYIQLDFNSDTIQQILTILYNRNMTSLLVEGGTILHNNFIKSDLWDEIRIETSPTAINNGVVAPDISHIEANVIKDTERMRIFCR
jgi:riboflavin biosynthesis protein RibD